MRATTPLRLLLVPAALLAAACGDQSDFTAPDDLPPAEFAETDAPEPAPTAGQLTALPYWADGYLYAEVSAASVYTPPPALSFNRSGGAVSVTKVAGATGRYVVRFKGLSTLLGTRTTVRVTGTDAVANYCKPVGAFLVRDSVEVRCFRMGTGGAANASFFLQVFGKRDDRAFAFGSQPTAANYTPASSGTWNPAGATRVYREGVGQYRVVFSGLGARLPAGVGGHVQVNAVSANKAYCTVRGWGGSPDLSVTVGCYSPAGAPADAKFTALFTAPAAHLAYAWADSPTSTKYTPYSVYASNPAGGAITITHYAVGQYKVTWTGVDPEIANYGSAQVTSWGEGSAQCKAFGLDRDYVSVQCFAANGTLMDAQYTVLLGS